MKNKCTVAVLLPAHNEEATIAQTIAEFKRVLPDACIYVCDNASNDKTSELATASGAVVIHESRKGKGFAVRRLFSVARADVYVLSDADLTYDAAAVPEMIRRLNVNHLAMITGVRQSSAVAAYRVGHQWGNKLFNVLFGRLFGQSVTDVFSGFRVMSHAFVKSIPLESSGFEVETELSATASALGVPTDEMPVKYGPRPEGSVSKLRTYRDGFRILFAYLMLYRQYKPSGFYSRVGGCVFIAATLLGVPLITEFAATGLVLKLPTAIVVMGMVVISGLIYLTGHVLSAITKMRLENRHLAFLQLGGDFANPLIEHPSTVSDKIHSHDDACAYEH